MSRATSDRDKPAPCRITFVRLPTRLKKRALPVLVAVLASGLITTLPMPVLAQAVHLVEVDVKLVGQGYRASKLIGRNVVNDQNETIGEIDDLIIDKKNVLYAILQVGSFLGLGGHLVALPFDSLKLDETGNKVTLTGATKESLEKLEEFKYEK
jgi:hypothetical protein